MKSSLSQSEEKEAAEGASSVCVAVLVLISGGTDITQLFLKQQCVSVEGNAK